MTWSEMQPLLEQGTVDTLYMVLWATFVTVLGGLPLGILLVLTDKGGLLQNRPVNKVVGAIVNVGRSLPFIILLIALIPFTTFVVGTFIGPTAMIVPLAIGAIPFFARLVETAIREVDHGLVEAVQAMGGGIPTIVRKVLLPQALPSLVSGVTTTVIVLIGYSAMAGAVGGEGLGSKAVTYGYQRFDTTFMLVTVVVLVVIVTVVQLIGDGVVRLSPAGAARPEAVLPRPRLRPSKNSPDLLSRRLPLHPKEALFVRKNIKLTAGVAATAALALGLSACGTSSDPSSSKDSAGAADKPSSSPRPRRRTPTSSTTSRTTWPRRRA